jgi:DNA (cytosine-5)-methyltransferase 1
VTQRMKNNIPVIDLFAGPGGLNHGFSAYRSSDVRFDVRLSIEKDEVASRTLLIRAFLRQFRSPPATYYRFLRGEDGADLEGLARKYPAQWAAANQEVRQWTLGEEPFFVVSEAIRKALANAQQRLLLGGPPCQAYSLAGRVRMKNQPKFTSDTRHTLYREYLKIVAVHQPTFFVMENVKGILSSVHGARGSATSVFHQILEDLRDPGAAMATEHEIKPLLPPRTERHTYAIHSFVTSSETPESLRPKDFVIRSEDWSVPQKRHRVILFGVRGDVKVSPMVLQQLFPPQQVKIEDVIGSLPKLRSRLSGSMDTAEKWFAAIEQVHRKATTTEIADPLVRRALSLELKRVRLRTDIGAPFKPWRAAPKKLARWLWDNRLGGVIQHQSRSHMPSDLRRYYFAACAAKEGDLSPKLRDFPSELLPDHKNAKPHAAGTRESNEIDFEDRFRVQIRGVRQRRSPRTFRRMAITTFTTTLLNAVA